MFAVKMIDLNAQVEVSVMKMIDWLYIKIPVEKYTSFVVEIVEAKGVIFEVDVLNKVDKYREMIWLEQGTIAV